MTAKKNDKLDAKPAMQFVSPLIWEAVRDVDYKPRTDFPVVLLDLINEYKTGHATWDDILVLIATQYGRVPTMRAVGLAMRAGEIKYGDWNFLDGHGQWQLLGAIERHALHILEGQRLDSDTSERLGKDVTHYGCIVAGINMILYQEAYGTSRYDGPPQSKGESNGICIESSAIDARITGTNPW